MFQQATKKSIKVRLAISGAAGSGKTYSALSIASNLGKSIALIDTEHGSANRYADLFNFCSCDLTEHHPAKYIEAINAAAEFDVLIIDSLSHAWYAELEMVDQAKNSFGAWKNVRPLERELINTILSARCHIIATMRSKTEWTMDSENGKNKPVKIGLAPVQTSGIEYEFDVAGDMNQSHILTISKSRCPALTDKTFLNPGKEIADLLLEWIKPPIWKNWKSPEDAIIWASEQLTDWDIDEIQKEFNELPATNGKKAPAWVDRVRGLAKR